LCAPVSSGLSEDWKKTNKHLFIQLMHNGEGFQGFESVFGLIGLSLRDDDGGVERKKNFLSVFLLPNGYGDDIDDAFLLINLSETD
jgi:hypothetical protein